MLAKGLAERIGDAGNGIVTHETDGQEWTITPQLHNYYRGAAGRVQDVR